MRRRILVVEDHHEIAHLLELHLSDLGCEVDLVDDGAEGLFRAREGQYDLVILDIMLPGLDGLDVCRRLRAQMNYVPILMLTAKSAELDRVAGLDVGADDYLTKPFSIRELLARVRALFRRVDALSRATPEDNSEALRVEDLEIDPNKRKVLLSGQEVQLTAREFELLLHFARHPGRVYTRAQLLDMVWGYGHDGYEHTVNSHINRLRAKIEKEPAQPRYILTVWGVGYKFRDPTAVTSL
jgi:two-component system OmpR family response regulator